MLFTDLFAHCLEVSQKKKNPKKIMCMLSHLCIATSSVVSLQMCEASSFGAYHLPPGTCMFPQAPKAVDFSRHEVISCICAAAKPV